MSTSKTDTLEIKPAEAEADLQKIADLATVIWHEHFPFILTEEQIDYMVDKFQSFHALKEQTANGYEYFRLFMDGVFIGYTGIHEENGRLFLSKLYIKKDFRGRHISTKVFAFLVNLCRERGLSHMWLTCNKHNDHTLKVYDHLGFKTVRSEKNDIGNGFFMDDYIMEYEI